MSRGPMEMSVPGLGSISLVIAMKNPAIRIHVFRQFLDKFSIWASLVGMACLGFAFLFRSIEWLQILFFAAPLAILSGLLFFILLPFSTRPYGVWKWALIGMILGGIGLWGLFYIGEQATIGGLYSRVRGDLSVTSHALDEYYKKQRSYPSWSTDPRENALGVTKANTDQPTFRTGPSLSTLTTPVAYLTSLFMDYFAPMRGAPYCYWTDATADTTATGYILWSAGPDGGYNITLDNVGRVYNPKGIVPSPELISLKYDPSNGVSSGGDIYRLK